MLKFLNRLLRFRKTMGILTAAFFILLGIAAQRFLLDPRGFIEDGALLICESRDTIFLLRDGIIHALPDLEQSQQLGFDLTRLVEVSCERLEEFPEGEPITQLILTIEGITQVFGGPSSG